jgi:protein-disulfide isomerase
MSTTPRGRNAPNPARGRSVPTQKRSLLPFYLVLGIVAVLGGIWLINQFSNSAAAVPPSAVSVEQAIKPFDAPVGRTDDGFYYKGDPNAPVKVVEYSDFQCPGCGSYARSTIAQDITKNYVETGKIQFIYHDFPLNQHRNAIPAATAARCAGDQDPQQFWRMHDLLFNRQAEWGTDADPTRRFASYAGELGLNQSAFEQCYNSGQYTQPLQDAAAAATAAGVQATPTFAVDGQLVTLQDGTELAQAIDAALAAKEQ